MRKIEKLERELEQQKKLVKDLVERLGYYQEDFLTKLKDYRNIQTICSECGGTGIKAYGNTSMWRHGIGGNAITSGICDKCWGSGDESNQWTNLRTLSNVLCDSCKKKLL